MKIIKNSHGYNAISSYEEKDLLKTAGFRWDPSERHWWTDDLQKVAMLLNVAEISDDIKNELAASEQKLDETSTASRAVDSEIDIPSPAGLNYFPFQKAGIDYALRRPNTLIADEMGLGKTIQAIGVINALDINSVLVICPASLRLNWQRELQTWLTRPLAMSILANGNSSPNENIVIINFDILKKNKEFLTSRQWDLCIIDEVHYIKNPKAIRTKLTIEIARRANKILALTGTPILNRPREIYTALNLLDPVAWPNFFTYAKRYCAAFKDRFGWNFDGASNLDELQERLRSSLMVRRLKADVLTDLPAKLRQVVVLPQNGLASIVKADAAAAAKWEGVIAELESEISDDYDDAISKLSEARRIAFAEISRVRHETALAKAPYVAAHVRNAAEQAGKIVVMAHHHDVIDLIAEELSDLGVVKLTGRDSQDKRQAAIDGFQTDPSINIFIGSIQAAGVGITLTASSNVIFAELDWVPGNVTQAEDRVHRIGQTDSVLIQHVVVDGTIDQRMASTLVSKQAVIDRALDDAPPENKPEVIVEPLDDSAPEIAPEKINTPLDDEQVDALHEAMIILAHNDPDGARELNGVGFNKFDAGFGHDLASYGKWSAKQAAAAKKMLKKYRRQIPDNIYDEIYLQ